MSKRIGRRIFGAGRALGLLLLLPLAGCGPELLDPKGSIGEQEKNLILIALGLMLLVVIPVILLTLYFAWRYRASNDKAEYAPNWAHSTRIELVVWTIPCIIIGFLAVLIWRTSHSLDPYQPLESRVQPVRVEVVALNWKWLFIYPDYGIASVNRLVIPTGTPVDFKITAESIMNSFFIPQLGSQIYAMPGMQTQLHLIADKPGTYLGESASFSGPGFSGMRFDAVAVSRPQFDRWLAAAQNAPRALDRAAYKHLAVPSYNERPALYAHAQPDLFLSVVNSFMPPGMQMSALSSTKICRVED